MTDANPRDLIKRLAEKLDHLHCQYNVPNQSALIAEARAYLAQPEPQTPSWRELFDLLMQSGGNNRAFSNEWLEPFALAVLARWGIPPQ